MLSELPAGGALPHFATDTRAELDALTDYVHRHIRLASHFGFRLLAREGASLCLMAPLAANANDKGTFFAGSISTLCTLAGWGLATRMAADLGIAADVLAMASQVQYAAPVTSDILVQATVAEDNQKELSRRLLQGRRSRVTVTIVAGLCTIVPNESGGIDRSPLDEKDICVRFEGMYLVAAKPVA